MSQPGSRDGHVQLRLGVFVLGALPLDEHLAVEEHLAQCALCRAECDELSEVPAFLSLLSEEDVRLLADEFAPLERETAPVPADPPFAAAGPSTGSVRQTPPTIAPRGAKRAGLGPVRPAGVGRGVPRRVAASLSYGGRGRLLVAGIMITLVVGVGIGTWLQASGGATAVPTTLAAAATDRVTGASVSVVVTGRDSGAHVEATLRGLRSGVDYQLLALTVRGETEVVTRWMGSDGQTTVVAELAIVPRDLASFTVTQMDGAAVVSVRVTSDTPTP
jgi:hypothetical protein